MIIIIINGNFFDYFESGQRLPMKKRGHYSSSSKSCRNDGKSKTNKGKKEKAFKLRRSAIKRGELGMVARFGEYGCSSWF